MREMKDSGIEWIGEIPADWELSKIGAVYEERNEKVSDVDFQPLSITKQGVVPQLETAAKTNDGENRKLIRKNDFVINSRSDRRGSCGISEYDGSCSLINTVLKPRRNMCNAYYSFVFRSERFADEFYRWGNGIVDDLWSTKWSNMKRIYIPAPSLQEQRCIADYLDRKCSQIDAIIARQQEVIEKLKAYKLSVITEAVTKGLSPDVPMKDSGVEWIGEIPEHWDFRRIKNCCLIVDCKNRTPDPDPDGEYIVVRTTCIRDGSFSYEGSYHTNAENFKEWTAKGQPQHGDIFFTREAPMGEACLVPDADNLCMGQRVMFFRPLDGSDPRYILYSIYGPLAREYIDSKNKGSTVGHLKLGQVASLPLFYCPPKEQSEVADYLDKRCGAIDKVVEKKAEIISKLTDYKKSLIYEVVTGKKEV